MEYITSFITGKSFCPFGDAAVWGLQSNIDNFADEFLQFIHTTNPKDIGPVLPIRPIYRPDEGRPSHLRDSALKPSGETPLLRDKVMDDSNTG